MIGDVANGGAVDADRAVAAADAALGPWSVTTALRACRPARTGRGS